MKILRHTFLLLILMGGSLFSYPLKKQNKKEENNNKLIANYNNGTSNSPLIMEQENTTGVKIQKDFFFIEVRASQLRADIYLNDILLFPKEEESGLSATRQISSWLVSGQNTLKAHLFAPKDSLAIKGELDIIIYLHDKKKDYPTLKEVLTTLHFSGKEEEVTTTEIVKDVAFDFDYPTPTKLWTEATQIKSLSDDDKSEIVKLIERLRLALLDPNKVEDVVKLQGYKIAEDALCEGREVEGIKEAVRESSKWLHEAMPNLTSDVLNTSNAVFELSGNNRIIYVKKSNGDDAVQLKSGDDYIAVRIYISKINNVWTIVR